MKTFFYRVIPVFLLFALITTPAFATVNYWGYRWENPNGIRIYIDNNSLYSSPALRNSFQTARNNWNNDTASHISFSSRTSEVSLGINCYGTYEQSLWDGLATPYSYTKNGISYFQKVDIEINVYHAGSYSSAKLLSVAAHELGHALGLSDVYGNYARLMNSSTQLRWDTYGINRATTAERSAVNYLHLHASGGGGGGGEPPPGPIITNGLEGDQ